MNNTKAKSTPSITGIRRAMEAFGTRIPPEDASNLRKYAKKFKCTCADIIRTAVSEFLTNHELRG